MKPSVAIIGAKGEMGRYLLAPLVRPHASRLVLIDKDDAAQSMTDALACDIILLSVPQNAVAGILRDTQLKPAQLVIDICSVKKDLDAAVAATGAAHLSLHPMNGPHTPWTLQKWVVIGDGESHPHAQWFLGLLREKKVLFHPVRNAAEHDLLMSVVLGLPEAVSVLISRYVDAFRVRHPDLSWKDILTITSPAFASLLATHVHAIRSTRPWLRKELMLGMHPEFFALWTDILRTESSATPASIEALMERQPADTEELPLPEELPVLIRERVTEDFNLLNQLLLGGGLKPKTDLYIQKPCTGAELLAGRSRISVGIHGIRGAFTDEAWQRFAREELGLKEEQYDVKELVHSANVLRAVEAGEVDVGIFAFANSGSGGYLASIEAMGEHPYVLRGLFTMPINMCILARPEIESVHDLTRFFGHPVALSQCRNTLAQRWPDMPVEAATDEMDTALSARCLADGTIDGKIGVFASKRAAELYGLQVLVEGVHHDPNNATAFAVVTKR